MISYSAALEIASNRRDLYFSISSIDMSDGKTKYGIAITRGHNNSLKPTLSLMQPHQLFDSRNAAKDGIELTLYRIIELVSSIMFSTLSQGRTEKVIVLLNEVELRQRAAKKLEELKSNGWLVLEDIDRIIDCLKDQDSCLTAEILNK